MEAFISQTTVSYEYPSELIYEKKFDTAVRDTFLASFEERYKNKNMSLKDRIMFDLIPSHMKQNIWRKDATLMGYVIPCIFKNNLKHDSVKSIRLRNQLIMEAMQLAANIQLGNILKSFEITNKPITVNKINSFMNTLTIPREVSNLVHFSSWMTKVIDNSAKCKRRQGGMTDTDYKGYLTKYSLYSYDQFPLNIILGDGIILCILDQTIWVAPTPILLMIQNKVADMISVLMFASFSSNVSLPNDAYMMTIRFILELSYLLRTYRNKFFDIVRSLEGICIAESLCLHEDWTNTEFLRVTAVDMFDGTGFDYMSSILREIILEANTPMRHQLCCLSKILGHPYVNMEAGAKSLYAKTTEVYNLNLNIINDCISHIKLNYIRNHILRKKKWPPCHIEYGASLALTQAFIRQRDPYDNQIISDYGKITLMDMNFVEIDQNENFQKLENVIPYLKDKTITLLRSRVLGNLLGQPDDTKPSWEDTRLLLAYLLSPSVLHDHLSFIEKYESSDDLLDLVNYLVIRIVPKEKELKTEFRGFGCKTYEDRFRALAQEKNAMRFLDEYSDEQAMTLSELEILKRLYTFRNLYKAYPAHKIIYVNIDAKAWNNHFRKETVDDVLRETLDKIFGTTIYSKTHQAYLSTLFYIPGYPNTYWWEGQGGGIEGLNQDSWVIVYLGQIKTALDGLGFKYHVLCKGDDLRLAIAIPPAIWKNSELSAIKNDIVGRLSNTMKSFGHQIKVIESYGSSTYFCFSKSASLGRTELPQGFRKIQKCYGASNAMIATLDEYIGSTFSNAHSACKVEPNVLPAYLVALFWSLVYLTSHPQYSHLNANILASMMLIPSLAGGFPIIYLHNMSIRAESDLLSPFIELYNFCKVNHPPVAMVMERFMHAPVRNAAVDPMMLYKDPYSIPHDRPPLPSAVLRGFIFPILQKYTKQEDIRELIRASRSEEMSLIKDVLKTASEFNVKILSAIYAATPEGILDELIKKFESARSINELMLRSVGVRKSLKNLRKVVRAERRLQVWRKERIKGNNLNIVHPYYGLVSRCPAESAASIRRLLWNKEILGITMPPLQHQVIMMTAFAITTNKWVNENHFTFTIEDPTESADSFRTDHYSSGDFKPFLGYSTRNGMTEPTIHFIEKDPMLLKVKNLLDLVSWTNTSCIGPNGQMISSNCPDLIKLIIQSFSHTPISSLAPFSGVRRSGTIQHHVRSPSFRESIVPNVLSNTYSKVLGESNTHVRYRTSRDHYYVNFLHTYCYAIWLSFLELEVSAKISTPRKVWAVSSECEYCSRTISERPIVFDLSTLRGSSLHPLAVSKIGQVAENILRKSLEESADVIYNIDKRKLEGIGIDVATQGILHEIIEQTYYTRMSVQNRYETKTLKDDAYQVLSNLIPKNKSRDVGQSEIKRIPIMTLVEYVSLLIVHFSSRFIPTYQMSSRSSYLSTLEGESLPWYGLVTQIHKAGKLPKVILHLSKFIGSPHPTCFYNPATASKFLCRYADFLLKYLKLETPIVILSYYTNSNISNQLSIAITGKILHLIRTSYHRYIPTKVTKKQDDKLLISDEVRDLYAESLCLLAVIYYIDDIVDDLASTIIENHSTRITGFGLDTISEVLIDDYLTTTDGYPIDIHNWIVLWERKGIYIDDLIHLVDWETILNNTILKQSSFVTNIHYTNTGTCCLVLRSTTTYDTEDTEEEGPKLSVDIPKNPELITLNKMDKPCVLLFGTEYTIPAVESQLPVLTLVPRSVVVKFHELFATIGSNTGSETTLLYILYNQGIVFSIENSPIFATCFADGFGGFTSVLLNIFRRSTIIYHTIPEDSESDVVVPVVDRDDIIGKVIVDYIQEGYYDLSEISTYDRIRQYNQYNDFITSDLELSDTNLDKHLSINMNIIIHYLQTRTRDCWLIIKLDMRKIDDICTLIDIGLHFCVCVCLHSPRSNDCSRYVYMIAKGWKRSYDKFTIDTILSQSHTNNSIHLVSRYCKQVEAHVRYLFIRFSEGLDLMSLDMGFRLHPTMRLGLFQDRLPSLLLSEFEIPVILEVLDNVSGTMAWKNRVMSIFLTEEQCTSKSIFQALGMDVDQYLDSLMLQLLDVHQFDLAVRRHAIICTMFKLMGCVTVVESFINISEPCIVSLEQLNSGFNSVFDLIEDRDLHGCSLPGMFIDNDFEHEGMKIRYHSSFQRGITIGLVLLGTLITFCKEPRKKEEIEKKRREKYE